jgi:hypothetical protein
MWCLGVPFQSKSQKTISCQPVVFYLIGLATTRKENVIMKEKSTFWLTVIGTAIGAAFIGALGSFLTFYNSYENRLATLEGKLSVLEQNIRNESTVHKPAPNPIKETEQIETDIHKPSLKPIKATEQIEAEKRFSNKSGTKSSSFDIYDINDGDWLKYDNIDFGQGGLRTFLARINKGNANQGSIQIRLDNYTNGLILGELELKQTCKDWGTWTTQSTSVENTNGIHNIYLVFKGGPGICNIDWFKFQ